MQLQTIVDIPAFPQKISYNTPLFFIGSCFAANIGNAMQQRCFPLVVNPFGVVYNTQSVAQSLQRLYNGNPFTEKELVCCNELWTSFSHHSAFSNPDKEIFLQQANKALQQSSQALSKAKFVIVSLGTSWIYRHKEENCVVSNCHKFPAAQFERKKLTVEESVEMLSAVVAAKPDCTWIFTVSPIRHWKDGAHENQLSKATLLLAVEQLQQQFSNVLYFPAYEIMMDELRDYRFYTDDMIHPSAQAIDYIWQRFSEVVLDNETKKIVDEVEKIIAAKQHRPLHQNTESYKKFVEDLSKKIAAFKLKYPLVTIG